MTTTADRSTEPQLILPDHPEYDEARSSWNLAVDLRPAGVVLARSAEDVIGAVALATERGLRVAPQTTGHLAAPLPDLSDALLVRTLIGGVEVDAGARRARIGAGAIWSEVIEAIAPHGLAALSGSTHDVGVVGYLLGGGLSWLGRAKGLGANHVLAIEVVTADGRLVRCDAETEPELFWALRGGAGNFGVVTAIEIELFEIGEVFGGMTIWPAADARAVLEAWTAWCATAPDSVTTAFRFLRLPPLPEIPEPLRDTPAGRRRRRRPRRRRERAGAARAGARDGHADDGHVGGHAARGARGDPHGPAAAGAGHRRRDPARGPGRRRARGAAGRRRAPTRSARCSWWSCGSSAVRSRARPRAAAPARRSKARSSCSASGCRWGRRTASASTPGCRRCSERCSRGRREPSTRTSPRARGSASSCFPPDAYERLRDVRATWDPQERFVGKSPHRAAVDTRRDRGPAGRTSPRPGRGSTRMRAHAPARFTGVVARARSPHTVRAGDRIEVRRPDGSLWSGVIVDVLGESGSHAFPGPLE